MEIVNPFIKKNYLKFIFYNFFIFYTRLYLIIMDIKFLHWWVTLWKKIYKLKNQNLRKVPD